MSDMNQTDRRVLLGLGGVIAAGALAQILPSSAAAQDALGAIGPDACGHSARQGRKEFAAALGGDDRTFVGAMAFKERYDNDEKVREQYAKLLQPIKEKAQAGEDYSREFERFGKFVAGDTPMPQNCFGIIFWAIIVILLLADT